MSLGLDQRVFKSIVSASSNSFFSLSLHQMSPNGTWTFKALVDFSWFPRLLKHLCQVGERCLLPWPKLVHLAVRFGTERKILQKYFPLLHGIFPGHLMALLKWRHWRVGTKRNPQNIRKYGGKNTEMAKKWPRFNAAKSNQTSWYNFESLSLSGQEAKHVLLDGDKTKSHLIEIPV